MSDDQSDMAKSIVYSQNPLLYEGAAEQPRGAPFSFSYKKEQENNQTFDRIEQVWSASGVGRGSDDQQFAPLERKGTVVAETQDYQNKMDLAQKHSGLRSKTAKLAARKRPRMTNQLNSGNVTKTSFYN